MKKLLLSLSILLAGLLLSAQTVENIRVVPDGENLKITYRIGGSTDLQVFTINLSCSMDGAARFEPKAVIGDVGQNIRGGRSFYTIIWDVFEDVDEVVNPEIFISLELTKDETPEPVVQPTNRQLEPVQQEEVKEQPVEEPKQQVQQKVEDPIDKGFEQPAKTVDEFQRNSFFAYSGILNFGTAIGVSFGSLNKWGYYVVPIRVCFNTFIAYYDPFTGEEVTDTDLQIMAAAGATRHIVSGGSVYRLHGFAGIGGHLSAENIWDDYYEGPTGHVMIETGVLNVIGPFTLSAGLAISMGYTYPVNFIFGAGFAF